MNGKEGKGRKRESEPTWESSSGANHFFQRKSEQLISKSKGDRDSFSMTLENVAKIEIL